MRALPDRGRRSIREDRASITRSRASADQRGRILRAVGELVAKRGYRAVTVQLIAKRARVSYSTFYKHFTGKEQAFLALYESYMACLQQQIEAALAAEAAAPWPRQMILALRAFFALLAAEPLIARACIVESLTVSREIIARHDASLASLASLLRRGRRFNPAAAALPATLEASLTGGVFWLPYQHLISGEPGEIEALLPEAVEFVLRPFLGDDEAARWARSTAQPSSSSATPQP